MVIFLVGWDWQLGHKVHWKVFLLVGRYWQGLQVTIGLVSDWFQSQTDVAAFDIGLNILSKARLIVFPTNELPGFIDTKVSC